ncbi:MAG: glycosyltransferase family 4 protein [Capsulimonadales bacterium]|nr:glycosyltransferase family 4 protein [Capsulimonadales bacterium]
MKILWLNDFANFTGGCERYIFDTATLLAARGVESSILYDVTDTTSPAFTKAFAGGAFPRVDLARQIRELAPDVIYVHRLNDSRALETLANGAVPSVRFFHDHKLFCPREHKYTVLTKETCTRTVGFGCFTCLGVVNKVPREQGLIRLTLPGTLRQEQRRNAETFTAIVVGSQYMADHVTAHGFDRDRVHSLPLFVRQPEESIALRSVTRENDLLLFVGQLTTGKAVDILLRSLKATTTPARLLIHGTGKFEAEYRNLTSELGLNERVTFGGKADGDTLAAAYRRAAAVVFPSRTPETFGLVGPEAMSHGTPVIATRVGGMTEWLEQDVTGLAVPPNDVAALTAAIDRLMTDDELRRRLGQQGRQRYFERFTPERHVERLLEVFHRLTGRSIGATARTGRPETRRAA